MHFRSKLTSEIDQKIGGLDGKTEQTRLKMSTLSPFFQKTTVFIEKHKSFFYCKNNCTYKFYVFAVKSALGNVSENSDFRFENSLKIFHFVDNISKSKKVILPFEICKILSF